jgi:Ca-activated chloride channel family protein
MRPKPTVPVIVALLLLSPAAWAGVLLPHKNPEQPLKVRKEQISVRVTNQVVQASVIQVFENQTGQPVDATYVFVPPRGAAVSGFATWVKGQKIESRVQEKKQAAETYAEAKQAGGAPALLSQLDKGTFKMKVARIEPGKTRRVELRYEGILDYRSGTIALHLPLKSPAPIVNVPRGELTLTIDITDSKEIAAVRPGSLPVKQERLSAHHVRVSYSNRDGKAPDQDLRLQYDVRSKKIGLTFLSHRIKGEDGFFMLLAAPQELTTNRDIVKKDVVFVFDVSGSMAGEKIEQARGALKKCLSFMNRGDRFGIVAFSDGTNPYKNSLDSLEPKRVQKAEAFINRLEPNGGTNIHLALLEGLKLTGSSGRPKVIIFLTDGQATAGITDSRAILAAVKQANARGVRIFTFGVGSYVNNALLERLGKENRGGVDFIGQGAALEQAVAAFYTKISRPVLSDLSVSFGSITAAMTYPNVLPDLYKGSQLLLVGRYRGEGAAKSSLSGMLNGARKSYAFTASFPHDNRDNAFLPRLWASRRIDYLLSQMRMHGETQEGRQEVIRLSKRHHIATRYTSLVATAPRTRLASLSPARVKPGDPEIRIRAPHDARAVTVVFPFGVTKAARFEAEADVWTVRFLIPRNTPDGTYPVTILVTTSDGKQQTFRVSYTVDTSAPQVKLALSGPVVPGATVTLTATQIITEEDLRQVPNYRPWRSKRLRKLYARMIADTRQVQVRLPSGALLRLAQESPGGPWNGVWSVPADLQPGSRSLEVMATDVAGNRSVERLDIVVGR